MKPHTRCPHCGAIVPATSREVARGIECWRCKKRFGGPDDQNAEQIEVVGEAAPPSLARNLISSVFWIGAVLVVGYLVTRCS